jgi:hypothetical protein
MLADQISVAFEEDRRMIEAQQKIVLENPDKPMLAIAADAGPLLVRQRIAEMLKAEARSSAVAERVAEGGHRPSRPKAGAIG